MDEQMDQSDSSDCEIIDSIDIVKQEPFGSPEPAIEIEIEDETIVENTPSFNLSVVKQEKEDKSIQEDAMISLEPKTDELQPQPEIDIKIEKLIPDVEPSEAITVPKETKESESTLIVQESCSINPEVSSAVETDPITNPEPEAVPKIQAIPTIELITPVKIKQEPREKTPPPLPPPEVNFGASTSQGFLSAIIKPDPPSSPPPENPIKVLPNLKTEPLEIGPGNFGVAPQFINLDDFTMDNKRKRGYCEPLGEFHQSSLFS